MRLRGGVLYEKDRNVIQGSNRERNVALLRDIPNDIALQELYKFLVANNYVNDLRLGTYTALIERIVANANMYVQTENTNPMKNYIVYRGIRSNDGSFQNVLRMNLKNDMSKLYSIYTSFLEKHPYMGGGSMHKRRRRSLRGGRANRSTPIRSPKRHRSMRRKHVKKTLN
jgi:hypothetical protein